MIINELEKVWNEVVVTYFEVLSRHLHDRAEEDYGNVNHEIRCPGPDSNRAPPEYMSEVSLFESVLFP
jgi:hypothetical protein